MEWLSMPRRLAGLALLLHLIGWPAGVLGKQPRSIFLRQRVQNAVDSVKSLLNSTRRPEFPADVPHSYDDKFLLVEFAGKAAAAGTVQLLDGLAGQPGWWEDHKATLLSWSQAGWPISMQFVACERCDFERTEEKDLDSGTKTVSESVGGLFTTTSKTVTTIQEHYWLFNATWQILVYPVARESEAILLQRKTGLYTIKTSTALNVKAVPPRPQVNCNEDFKLDLSWLVARAGPQGLDFVVNRSDEQLCRTPRRNAEVDAAVEFFNRLKVFSTRGFNYFTSTLFPVQEVRRPDVDAVERAANDVTQPVLALFSLDSAEKQHRLAFASNFAAVLAEHSRSLARSVAGLKEVFPADVGLITLASASLATVLLRTSLLGSEFLAVVEEVEQMLYSQFADAIGKQLSSSDFAEYMDFHHTKLFDSQLRPSRFSYAVRRPGQSPEGVVSLETTLACSAEKCVPTPIQTVPARRAAGRPISLALNAATDVQFLGERYVHSIVLHKFASEPLQRLSVVARARQFSSFVLLVGKVLSADRFEPKAALIIKDKDDLTLPLMLETVPSAKEFREAVESLSPEQMSFARAFREMQLSSTLFGLLVVQIKPQMEEVLNLPPNSLTKEIQLTQDLMDLFIKYQVPSDLLSYDDTSDSHNVSKLQAVQDHVSALLATIDAAKQKELEEERAKAESKRLRHERPPSCPAGGCTDDGDVYSAIRLGKSVAVLDFTSIGSSLALRSYSRLGTGISVVGMARMGKVDQEHQAYVSATQDAYSDPLVDAAPPAPAPAKARSTRTPAEDPQVPEPAPAPERRQGEPGASEAEAGDDEGQETEPDYSALPGLLDRQFERLDVEGTLRPTTVTPGPVWTKRESPGLLAPMQERSLASEEDQEKEKNRAFDLLDALTRSGAMQLRHASLHVILAATHAFDRSLVDSIVQGNVNPIEKVERSMLIMTSTLHQRSVESVLAQSELTRVKAASPGLFTAEAGDGGTSAETA